MPWTADAIIRDELFSIERLELHAASLASAQAVTARPPRRRSLDLRLKDNAAFLLAAYRALAGALREDLILTQAAEWFIDNYHLVESQILEIHDDLPPGYYRQLPKLASGPFAGYPRVFGMAWACVAHSDSRFEVETLRRFVRSYQQVEPLTIGELWALAITLRIVLVENLRRLMAHIIKSRDAVIAADQVADELLHVTDGKSDPDALVRRVLGQAPIAPAFLVQLVKRLRHQDPQVTPALLWLESLLAKHQTTPDQIVQDEHQRQGAANVTVRNIITSMRLITDVNWQEFFESVSLVDEVLGVTPVYARMDFPTRNLYRSAVEDLARGSSKSELAVAHAAVVAAARPANETDRERDPGYYLIAAGRAHFEREIRYRVAWRDWPRRVVGTLGPLAYIAFVLMAGAAVLAAPLWSLSAGGVSPLMLGLFALFGAVPAIDLAVALVNRSVTRRVGATILPALALHDGIPGECRTMVVVPTLLTSQAAIEALIERLEVHYLASGRGEIYFALLADWTDAATEHTPQDEILLACAQAGIARLNQRHAPPTDGPRFLLYHRRRLWSDSQQCWMGWERKRGKLHELNRLLRGARDTSFIDTQAVAPFMPAAVRYVITLDSDTRLPRDAASRLIGKMAHPLNAPRYDAQHRAVLEGYAILQPRVTASLPIGREGSLFQRVFSNITGINAYDTAAADVYQDLFGAGSYSGKGIYDIDAFEASLSGRVPEGTLLSHDLFEGTFARAGLVSDIEVIEEFPSEYDVAAARNHRWARGDWQLLPWLLGRGDAARRETRRLSLLAAWKMLDNLRRTLSAPCTLAALVAGWLLPLPVSLHWTLFVVGVLALPALLPIFEGIVPRGPRVTFRSYGVGLGKDVGLALWQVGLMVCFLAHQAWLMADAIARTLYRLFVSHRKLLEWVTAEQSQALGPRSPAQTRARMGGAGMLGLAVILLIGWRGVGTYWLALPFLLLWVASPLIARRISLSPKVAGRLPVSPDECRALRLVARRTWRYFETFVTPLEHMLPPDNFQEDPLPVIAHRTSPTNMGLYLLSVVSAREFGWIGGLEAVERLESTLSTMQQLTRFRGHFYNWYDTRDLRALEPRYVSSVDSGNLAAHLIALARTCEAWCHETTANVTWRAGVADALMLVRQAQATALAGALIRAQQQAAIAEPLAAVSVALELADSAAPATLDALAARAEALVVVVNQILLAPEREDRSDLSYWASAVLETVDCWRREVRQSPGPELTLVPRLQRLAVAAETLGTSMEFGFLLDDERKLLSIGYRADEGALDSNCYDLLASEARLASFFAIAKNDVATRHWFRLGRPVTSIGRGAALVSWSGSMFEYLMPALVMRAPTGSLLEQTSRLIVERQIAFAAAAGVPWGVSESAYNARDIALTYQYSNFGIPGLGLKRGLSTNLVIAPYATALAAMVEPRAAVSNFAHLTRLGACGRYGFYEALDYTRSRLPEGAGVAIVRAFMAHHQGMTLVAISNVLFDGRMRGRFHADPRIQAAELLLQERTPRDLMITRPRAEEVQQADRAQSLQPPELRRVFVTNTRTPQAHVLSNGRYSVMLTSAGGGYSRWQGLAITRWREDPTRDNAGSWLYLRDVASGAVWSATYQPCGVEPAAYAVTFTEDRVEYVRRDGTLTTTLQVLVSPEHDAEVRRISITNAGKQARELEVTSACELVLAPAASDLAHPAFSKLFVETRYLPNCGALIATRRRREPGEQEIWAAHQLVDGGSREPLEYETDRARFIGRCREDDAPLGVMKGARLSNTTGTVLDAMFALRHRVVVEPGATVNLSFWTMVASSRAELIDLLDKHHDVNSHARAATLAWTQAQAQLMHLGISSEEANLFQHLSGRILYADPGQRPPSAMIVAGMGPRDALWAEGISGDFPIVLVKTGHLEDLAFVSQLLQAHEFWRLKQLQVDLVILNERASSYVQDLQSALETAVRMSRPWPAAGDAQASGKVFVLRADLVSARSREVLSAVARVVLIADRGSLAAQLDRLPDFPFPQPRPLIPRPIVRPGAPAATGETPEFFNSLGGFTDDGREYLVQLRGEDCTPAPWINVLANAHFGTQIGAEGSAYTWSGNSRENQLTPWSNDPVSDPTGEAFYVRDEISGELFSPTRAPLHEGVGIYTARHGQGYSCFEHRASDLVFQLTVLVALDDPVKLSVLTLRNTGTQLRRLSVTAYLEWVLGVARSASGPLVLTSIDPVSGAMFARHPMNLSFGSRVAFADLAGRQTQWTADRREFLGRHGKLARPAALSGLAPMFSGRTGGGLDPCCALRTFIELKPGASDDIVLLLGQADSAEAAGDLVTRFRATPPQTVLAAVKDYWSRTLGTLEVRSPDRAFDLMLNRWLLYQTLACRMWARAAFYQASGAYGFRDQLQDSMALVIAQPALAREHLLLAASRQYPQGDVQHWWVPTTGQGVRTRISDDRVWLVQVALHYARTTGDSDVFDEPVCFIEGPALEAAAHESFGAVERTNYQLSLFEHCARALEASLAVGAHGLPLMGTGDWNDGMNRVGAEGRGESVWLGWMLYATLMAFAPLAEARGEQAYADRWRAHASALKAALESAGWDGAWYRRAYFDDGTALGSVAGDECRIDSIAQSWSVLSGAADPQRALLAMTALDAHLIRREDRLALLFTPPFDATHHDPGYVKAYPPGVRENGGQYTHAATWSIFAYAALGKGDKAAELFGLLNPIHHADSAAGMQRYRVEPYVVAADIYSVAPHVGRGGWTWYTGAAGWLYRAGIEAMLGFHLQGQRLLMAPCIPAHWPRVDLVFRYRSARYEIAIENPDAVCSGVCSVSLDGAVQLDATAPITLKDDGASHRLVVSLGRAPS